MAARGAEAPPTPGTTVRTETVATIPDSPNDLPIDAWLHDLGTKGNVSSVRVAKRNADGRWIALGREHAEILPPFDLDVRVIYDAYGDGDYKYAPMGQAGRPLTAAGTAPRIEGVIGYGPGKLKGSGSSPASLSTPFDADAAFRSLADQDRQQLFLDDLRTRVDERRAKVEMMMNGSAAPTTNPDAELDRLIKLVALMQPKQDGTLATVLTAVLQSQTQMMTALMSKTMNPPEPADKMFDTIGKVLELTERVRGPLGGDGESPDWKQMLIAAVAPAAQHALPAAAAWLARRNTPGAPPSIVSQPRPAAVHIAEPNPDALRSAARAVSHQPPNASVASPSPDARTETPPDTRLDAAHELFRSSLWPLIVTAAKRGSKQFDLYLGMIDDNLPGFVDQWASLPFDMAMPFLHSLDPNIEQDTALMTWLRELHTYAAQAPIEDDIRTEQPQTPSGAATTTEPPPQQD